MVDGGKSCVSWLRVARGRLAPRTFRGSLSAETYDPEDRERDGCLDTTRNRGAGGARYRGERRAGSRRRNQCMRRERQALYEGSLDGKNAAPTKAPSLDPVP